MMSNAEINSELQQEWLEIGTIVAAQGMKGELRVYPDSQFPERFEKPGERWMLRPGETEPQPVKLVKGRYINGKNLYVVQLAEVEDRDRAEALAGTKLMVKASDRPILAEDEYHVLDLIGLEVFLQESGENLGVVVNVIPAGNDLLEVQLHQQPASVPATDEPEPPQKGEVNRTSKKRKFRPKPSKPSTILIPFVKAIAPVVDLENRRIEITPPPGLLEINQEA
ncbi:ribosome maturation factor RimM [Coleofasciculus sp. H7-2]|uniref:ribosome maturation factor RimM n=1 Tax=Coleofasciculus sp. H7-2 TaxID=3351545 RepID=UPI0036712740